MPISFFYFDRTTVSPLSLSLLGQHLIAVEAALGVQEAGARLPSAADEAKPARPQNTAQAKTREDLKPPLPPRSTEGVSLSQPLAHNAFGEQIFKM